MWKPMFLEIHLDGGGRMFVNKEHIVSISTIADICFIDLSNGVKLQTHDPYDSIITKLRD